MPSFRFVARDRAGRAVNGLVTEVTSQRARDLLARRGLAEPIELRPDRLAGLRALRPVPRHEIAQVVRQLQVMLASGIPMGRALQVLTRSPQSQALREALERAETMVHEGSSLSAALAATPRMFPVTLLALIQVGEKSGTLLEILPRLAGALEEGLRQRSRLLAALAYPAFTLVASVALWLGLLVFYLPRMAEAFAGMHVPLSWPLRAMLGLGRLLEQPGPALLGLEMILFTVVVAVLWLRTPGGRDWLARTSLALPGVRGTVQAFELSQLCAGLALVTHAGVPLLEGLALLIPGVGNGVLRAAVEAARHDLREGASLSEAFRAQPALDPLLANMLEVGQTTGLLAPLLERLEKLYASQLEARLEMLTALIEPAIMAGMGVLVGGTVIMFMLPLAQLVSQF